MLALTRDVPSSFAQALCAHRPGSPIDVDAARRQHEAYRAALRELGVTVEAVAADEALPDCPFIEDTAVVAAGVALITRPGAPSRRAETTAVAAVLAERLELVHLEPPATLDGGDCMRVGSTIFVGRSARTNEAGIARLAAVFEPRGIRVVPIELPAGVLHLKCVCAPLGDDRITLADDMPPDGFGGLAIVAIPAEEKYAANVLAVGDAVLVAEGFPRSHAALAATGLRVVPITTTEFRKADGALTCLSIVI